MTAGPSAGVVPITVPLGKIPTYVLQNQPGKTLQIINTNIAATDTVWIGSSAGLLPNTPGATSIPAGTTAQWSAQGDVYLIADTAAVNPIAVQVTYEPTNWQPAPTAVGAAIASQGTFVLGAPANSQLLTLFNQAAPINTDIIDVHLFQNIWVVVWWDTQVLNPGTAPPSYGKLSIEWYDENGAVSNSDMDVKQYVIGNISDKQVAQTTSNDFHRISVFRLATRGYYMNVNQAGGFTGIAAIQIRGGTGIHDKDLFDSAEGLATFGSIMLTGTNDRLALMDVQTGITSVNTAINTDFYSPGQNQDGGQYALIGDITDNIAGGAGVLSFNYLDVVVPVITATTIVLVTVARLLNQAIFNPPDIKPYPLSVVSGSVTAPQVFTNNLFRLPPGPFYLKYNFATITAGHSFKLQLAVVGGP